EPFGIPSPAGPAVRVNRWLIAAMATSMAAFFGLVVRALVQAQRAPVTTGPQALIGRLAVVLSGLGPTGQVRVEGEVWSAVSENGFARAGEAVEIMDVEGVTLRVRRLSV
ncbi:MAG TPA: NfeD family protein, partial [Gemmatimonadaceae bacterium]